MYRILDTFPVPLSQKIKIVLIALSGNWRLAPNDGFILPFAGEISEAEIEEKFIDLDENSKTALKQFCRTHQLERHSSELTAFIYNYDRLYGAASAKQEIKNQAELRKAQKKFHFRPREAEFAGIVSHHGLKNCTASQHDYIADKIFIDAGACLGDSAVIFSKFYRPSAVLAFEPSQKNRRRMQEILKNNQIPSEKVKIIDFGLGSQTCQINFSDAGSAGNSLTGTGENICQIVSLDEFVKTAPGPIGVIKADIEGMGLELVRGGLTVIREHRPVLLLSIYHNRDEFFGIYELLRPQLHNYEWRVECLSPLPFAGEATLIGIPREASCQTL